MNILKIVVNHPGMPLFELEITCEEEKQQILQEFRQDRDNLKEPGVLEHLMTHQLFERQAKQGADRIAVAYEDKQFTYSQLNEKINALSKVIENLD